MSKDFTPQRYADFLLKCYEGHIELAVSHTQMEETKKHHGEAFCKETADIILQETEVKDDETPLKETEKLGGVKDKPKNSKHKNKKQ